MHFSLTLVLLPIIVLSAMGLTTTDSPCHCLNGGTCSPLPPSRCLCPQSYIGESCQLPATEITQTPLTSSLTTNYSYFYFQPDQINYYKLTFNICMLDNSAQSDSLFYIETERADGTLRTVPSMFETAKLVLDDSNCANFATHYISVKRREDDTFRKIVIGLKIQSQGDEDKFLNVYPQKHPNSKSQERVFNSSLPLRDRTQKISLKMSYQVYIQTSYYGTFIILFTSFVLLLILTSLITYLRKKYSLAEVNANPIHSFHHQLHRPTEEPFRANPEDYYRPRRNSISHLDIFMPVTRYGVTDSVFLPQRLINQQTEMQVRDEGEACPICLVEFQLNDPIRTTPCRHRYHRECIDNWCEAKMSCPICRRELDFSLEIRRIYYAFLRNELRA